MLPSYALSLRSSLQPTRQGREDRSEKLAVGCETDGHTPNRENIYLHTHTHKETKHLR